MGEPGPFERHVREAIALNRQRRAGYVRAGGLRAALVSRALVGSERALLPVARTLDAEARRAGCETWAAAFAPMHAAPEPTRPVTGSRAGARGAAVAFARGARPLARAGRALARGETDEAAAHLDAALARVREAAESRGLHLAMTVHLLESARLALSLAGGERARGRCAGPLARFARLHLAGLGLALQLDAHAAPLHARGVGLIANDLPPIPAP